MIDDAWFFLCDTMISIAQNQHPTKSEVSHKFNPSKKMQSLIFCKLWDIKRAHLLSILAYLSKKNFQWRNINRWWITLLQESSAKLPNAPLMQLESKSDSTHQTALSNLTFCGHVHLYKNCPSEAIRRWKLYYTLGAQCNIPTHCSFTPFQI